MDLVPWSLLGTGGGAARRVGPEVAFSRCDLVEAVSASVWGWVGGGRWLFCSMVFCSQVWEKENEDMVRLKTAQFFPDRRTAQTRELINY